MLQIYFIVSIWDDVFFGVKDDVCDYSVQTIGKICVCHYILQNHGLHTNG